MSRLGLYSRLKARRKTAKGTGPDDKVLALAIRDGRQISKNIWLGMMLCLLAWYCVAAVPSHIENWQSGELGDTFSSESVESWPQLLHPRRLAAASNCSASESDKSVALAVPYLMIILYCFLGLAIVCDEYFEPALSMISEKLELSDDVAGATFMAAGSSAPELFTSFSDTFISKNSIGIGTIVGSAMFNILVIVAMSAAVTKGSVRIDWRPVVRDVFFYLVSIGVLVIVMVNGRPVCVRTVDDEVEVISEEEGKDLPGYTCGKNTVTWEEGLGMVCLYVVYILVMRFNKQIFAKCGNNGIKVYDVSQVEDEKQGEDQAGEGAKQEEEEDDEPWYKMPDGIKAQVYWIVSLPLVGALHYTVPNVEKGRFKNWYISSFIMSIIWIGLLCLAMVSYASSIGCILDIAPVIMGVVLLAAGTSVPDMIASMIVARQGHADMAIANAVGSNVFDILLGLGLPWALVGPILGNDTIVDANDIVGNVVILVGTVVLYVGVIVGNKWKMNSRIGIIFASLYVIYIIYSLLSPS